MKRLIPLLLRVLVGGIAVYLHPQWFHKAAPANMLKLSGNIEAHESLVSFKERAALWNCPLTKE